MYGYGGYAGHAACVEPYNTFGIGAIAIGTLILIALVCVFCFCF